MLQDYNTTRIEQFYTDVAGLQLKFPVADVSKKTGFSKGNVSQYLNRKATPSREFLKKFYEVYEVGQPSAIVKTTDTAAFSLLHSKLIAMDCEIKALTEHCLAVANQVTGQPVAVQRQQLRQVAESLQKLELQKLDKQVS